ncbi:MAG: 1,4-dihydroxy-2-naphthoate octaprenyltransferase [Bacteroidetes bacterium GWF2_42_66]|nr:MAG: 1,4-dihydroxy-2-naphthoate octaprenyltransferase [Bacteroidetes bacterium GWA2_42_15]OFY01779.1 MAG: 1,4-dihydroxy-2-naphthoate octaprenyltransferase [Bacteroidetes bacterium GWE2_42_39]OFY44928.1 MAG: 1,4-dihydroxy-2-naphthoate octaprenyltransferase [Bacteroidetes bacterium GWF2_42_66]HBL76058.1 1,4-dihydroxy-2-naphthoate octaprenyltransferase [Prolixibacteraceae bacterium]HCR89684.1 1,4-dihydroxy-2-naphthoate octaprenyltransferase [Prolixibacteraceae bacterium]
MASTKSWIKAARPRTLPLALSGIITGSGLAYFYGEFDWLVCLLAIVTATSLQIFSNFANDYGDFQRGTDNQQRVGPVRTMQGGEISKKEMQTGMFILIVLCMLFGLWLVYEGTWEKSHTAFFWFLGFGILSLLAAFFYTAGKRSYGYVGLGDLSVFLFFGLLPVLGTFFLNAQYLSAEIVLPAISIGFFSTGVLNLNNIRDIENDRQSGKITLAVRMGSRNGKIYHAALIIFGLIAAAIFTITQLRSPWQWLFLLSAPLLIFDLIRIFQTSELKKLDPFLKRLALSAFAFSVLFCLGFFLS